MDATHTTPIDATTVVRSLSQVEIRRRLAELDAEADALRVLLRAVRARDRAAEQQREAVRK
jgi:hypothetical protein